MDQAAAEELALSRFNQGQGPEDEFAIMPDSAVRKPYGWVFQLQSRTYLETGDRFSMAVGIGPTIILDDGTVHTLGSARPPEEELYAFEAAHGLPITRDSGSTSRWQFDDIPLWVGAEEAGQVPVLALTPSGLASVRLHPDEVDLLVTHGPTYLDGMRPTVAPINDIDRIRTDGDTKLKVERRGDVNITVHFPTPADRDRAFAGLHHHLVPNAPVEQLRRPKRQFVEWAGLAVLVLAIGLPLPWMVERGQIDRTHWLVATIFNTLGPTGFRVFTVALALLFLAILVAIIVNNPLRSGFRVRGMQRP